MTIPKCRLIYPYYNNPDMLAQQIANWSRLEGDLRAAVRIIVVDDFSKQSPVPQLKTCKADVRCYQMLKKWPWNMHEARNVGAHVACKAAENFWLFMSDIDIMITPEMLYAMLTKELEPGTFYTMERTFAPNFKERKVHPNTFLVKHAVYWQVNGYDLDLAPVGGGGYGGDNQFMRQLRGIATEQHLEDIVLIGYGRQQRDGRPYIADADTSEWSREVWSEKYQQALRRKKASGDMRSVEPLRTPFDRVL